MSDKLSLVGARQTEKFIEHSEIRRMVNFRSVAACFPVADVDRTLEWYKRNLGFTCHPFPANPPYVFGILVRDSVEIMLQRVEGYEKPAL